MDKETFEALKKVIEIARYTWKYKPTIFIKKDISIGDIKQVEGWIDEVAKEYED